MGWLLENRGMIAVIFSHIVGLIMGWRQLLDFLRWLPSEIKATWNEYILKLPDGRVERPDYSDWSYFTGFTKNELGDGEYCEFKKSPRKLFTDYIKYLVITYLVTLFGLEILSAYWLDA